MPQVRPDGERKRSSASGSSPAKPSSSKKASAKKAAPKKSAPPKARKTSAAAARSAVRASGRAGPDQTALRWRRIYARTARAWDRLRPLRLYAALCGLTVAVYLIWAMGLADRGAQAASDFTRHALWQAGFRVETVTVAGRNLSETEDIRALLGVRHGEPIFDVDMETVRRRIEALDWIEEARVKRLLPDRLHIVIRERVPYAIWQIDGAWTLIDRDGAIIGPQKVPEFAHLPHVVGEGAARRAADLIDAVGALPSLRGRMKAATRVGNRRWNLLFDTDVVVRLPDEAWERALKEFAALESEHRLLTRQVEWIDMRFADRIIIRPLHESPQEMDTGWPRDNGAGGNRRGSERET